MRITKRQLRSIIKEAILLLEYEQYVYRDGKGNLRISDDDGNDEDASHLERQYGHLEADGPGETIVGTGRGTGSWRPAGRSRARRW
ncbi:MAG TPA: hypothetical protein EYG51_22060 [Pseudomonadales bacterium]|nr:hypothetical protein [Pseudomonadales bacterium]